MSRTDAPDPDPRAVAQALLRPRSRSARSGEMGRTAVDRQQEHAKEMAERMVGETLSYANRERTRLLVKDQLRMLLLFEDQDIAHLAAAELLNREPTSQRTMAYANGNHADIGYDATGAVYTRIYQAGPWDYWLPTIGSA